MLVAAARKLRNKRQQQQSDDVGKVTGTRLNDLAFV